MISYDDRDGYIWMDGEFIKWRNAKVHILTHALHYGSSVFEGERCYGGKIFKSIDHSKRLINSGKLMDIPITYTVDQIEDIKEILEDLMLHFIKENMELLHGTKEF